ncbi:MAG: hypothetical protein N2C12_15280 [Planctomycetales bacterium]
MPRIVVDDEQARIIQEATDGVEIRDGQGKHLGYIAHGFTSEDIAIAKQRQSSNERRYTTEEVTDHLESLDNK